MNGTDAFPPHVAETRAGASDIARVLALPYAALCYLVGVGGLAWLALSLAEVLRWPALVHMRSLPGAVLLDVALVALFGASHSVMARPGFKAWWTRTVPEWAERSTFVLSTGIMLAGLITLWQPLPSLVWNVANPVAAMALWALSGFGWAYMLASTFAINHFDLFGLRQAYFRAMARPYAPVPFQTRWMYRMSRHPLMAGVLLGVWATPHMTLGHIVLAVTLSTYIVVGVWYEERDLVVRFGDLYRRYRAHVGALFTLPGRGP
jgi:protein-S-isoprenylcysteine O-methyltransferase Ste14